MNNEKIWFFFTIKHFHCAWKSICRLNPHAMKIKCIKTMPKINPKCTQSNEHLMLWRICRQRPQWFLLTCKFVVVFVGNVCERLCQLFISYYGGFDGIMVGTRVRKCVFIWNICYFFSLSSLKNENKANW